jgi:HAMP domain-containing protein
VNDLKRIVNRFENRTRLTGVVVFNAKDEVVAGTSGVLKVPSWKAGDGGGSHGHPDPPGLICGLAGEGRLRLRGYPLYNEKETLGAVLIVHDATYIRGHLARIWRHTFGRVLAQMVLIAAVVLVLMKWSVYGPVRQMAEWMKKLRAGELVGAPPKLPNSELFAPLAREASRFAKHLNQAKSAAEEEARLRQTAESLWTAERLKEHVRLKLNGKPLIVVSNREPYMHFREGRDVKWIVPAGGLVTALDPVMRATGGTWVAHGAGDADADTVDEHQRLRVPPDDPSYTLRRVSITKEEENGYYYGFANEGLWPLCHIAHTRPMFRAQDYDAYRTVNEKFADAVLKEIEGIENPCSLSRITISLFCQKSLKPVGPTRGWRFFGTFPGQIRRPLGFALGKRNCCPACWAPMWWGFTPNSIATISWKPWTGCWNAELSGNGSRSTGRTTER